jgi:hypothetical protein
MSQESADCSATRPVRDSGDRGATHRKGIVCRTLLLNRRGMSPATLQRHLSFAVISHPVSPYPQNGLLLLDFWRNEMEPQMTEDWLFVARERGADAQAVIDIRPDSVGSVYLMGYAVECSLKAYLKASRIPFPTSGRAGHDLSALWRASGFSKRDISDPDGSKAFYFEGWSTSLRYYSAHTFGGLRKDELLQGAKSVVGWLQMQARRTVERGRRR